MRATNGAGSCPHSTSIMELKRSPSAVLKQAGSEPIAVLIHNRPAAYLLSPEVYEAMLHVCMAICARPSTQASAAVQQFAPTMYSPSRKYAMRHPPPPRPQLQA